MLLDELVLKPVACHISKVAPKKGPLKKNLKLKLNK